MLCQMAAFSSQHVPPSNVNRIDVPPVLGTWAKITHAHAGGATSKWYCANTWAAPSKSTNAICATTHSDLPCQPTMRCNARADTQGAGSLKLYPGSMATPCNFQCKAACTR